MQVGDGEAGVLLAADGVADPGAFGVLDQSCRGERDLPGRDAALGELGGGKHLGKEGLTVGWLALGSGGVGVQAGGEKDGVGAGLEL